MADVSNSNEISIDILDDLVGELEDFPNILDTLENPSSSTVQFLPQEENVALPTDTSIFNLNEVVVVPKGEEGSKISAEDAGNLYFNGVDMLESQSLIDCKLRPGPDAPLISVQLSLIDYEIMCK